MKTGLHLAYLLLICFADGAAPSAFRLVPLTQHVTPDKRESMPDMVRLTAADEGVKCFARVGEEAVVVLNETPTTGFRWSLRATPAKAVEEVRSEWIAPPRNAPGAQGRREFVVRFVAPGEVALGLKLWREWQGEGSVIERHEFHVRVEEQASGP